MVLIDSTLNTDEYIEQQELFSLLENDKGTSEKTVWRFLTKLDIVLPYDLGVNLRYLPKEI